MPYGKPVRVNPFIKTCRWSLLILGILYGSSRRARLHILEESTKEQRMREKAERDRRIAEEKRIASERDIQYLADIFTGKSLG